MIGVCGWRAARRPERMGLRQRLGILTRQTSHLAWGTLVNASKSRGRFPGFWLNTDVVEHVENLCALFGVERTSAANARHFDNLGRLASELRKMSGNERGRLGEERRENKASPSLGSKLVLFAAPVETSRRRCTDGKQKERVWGKELYLVCFTLRDRHQDGQRESDTHGCYDRWVR